MFEHLFIGLGVMALAVTALSTLNLFDNESRLIWSLMGMTLWAVWALQSQSVETVSGGVSVVEGYRSLLVVGVLFASLMLLSAVQRAFELIKQT